MSLARATSRENPKAKTKSIFFPLKECFILAMAKLDKEQRSALRTGSFILLGFSAFIITLWACSYLPGPVGRTFALFTGFLWTPTIMEPTLFTISLMTILVLNHHRKKLAGPDYIELESTDSAHDSNEQEAPPKELINAIQGAATKDDHKEAHRMMAELPPEFLESEEMVAIRLQMAHANNDPNHVRGLSRKLRELNPSHPSLEKAS